MDWLTPFLMVAFGALSLGFELLLKKHLSRSTRPQWNVQSHYFSLSRIAIRMESRSRWSVLMIFVGGLWLALEILF